MAIRALARWHSVPAGQQEPSRRVVKFGVKPVIAGMAGVARGGELCGNVVGIRRGLEIFEVAGTASR